MSFEFEIGSAKIETDKTLERIEHDAIFFTDGSWCDLRSGFVRNEGAGALRVLRVLQNSRREDEQSALSSASEDDLARQALAKNDAF